MAPWQDSPGHRPYNLRSDALPRFTIPIHRRQGGVISRVVSQIWGALACERLKYLRLLNPREGSLSERLFLLPVIDPLNLAEKYASHIA